MEATLLLVLDTNVLLANLPHLAALAADSAAAAHYSFSVQNAKDVPMVIGLVTQTM